jgi:hypothetical protein
MQKPDNLPKSSGVYILLHEPTMVAYVGNCSNLRHRAAVWEYNFKQLAKDPSHKMPVRGFPTDTKSEDWQFGGLPSHNEATIRTALVNQGWKMLNEHTRSIATVDWNGKIASLAEHARDAGIKYTKAYYRHKAGKPLNEVFATGD